MSVRQARSKSDIIRVKNLHEVRVSNLGKTTSYIDISITGFNLKIQGRSKSYSTRSEQPLIIKQLDTTTCRQGNGGRWWLWVAGK